MLSPVGGGGIHTSHKYVWIVDSKVPLDPHYNRAGLIKTELWIIHQLVLKYVEMRGEGINTQCYPS